jgi:hypothetical protein
MPETGNSARALSGAQIDTFIEQGFVRIDNAFPAACAEQARSILWRDCGCDPSDPATWTRPVVRLGMYGDPPFVAAANTPVLRAAFDQLVGPERWMPCGAVGTFPVRFPSAVDPGDIGWHVDAQLRHGRSGLHVLARQHPVARASAADAVPVL